MNLCIRSALLALPLTLLLAACDRSEPAPQGTAPTPDTTAAAPAGPRLDVDGTRIVAADQEPGNWLSHGRSYDEQRFSPLVQINDTNAATTRQL